MDFFQSRLEDIMADMKGRFKNPLTSSFILVWLYYHWRFTYEFFTVDKKIAVGVRGDYFKQYVIDQGWSGMIGLPIVFAFISLICFYLIGVTSQFIKLWLGKRLPAAVMYNFDKGNYELKVTSDRIKRENRELKVKEETLADDNDTLKSKLRTKESELMAARELSGKALEEKDKEIGEQRALNSELHREKKEEADKRALTEAENANLHETVNTLRQELTLTETQLNVLEEESSERQMELVNEMEIIFEDDATWRFTFEKEKEQHIEIFRVVGDTFVVQDKKNSVITISDFAYDGHTHQVYFKKSNNARGYQNVETRLLLSDSNTLIGYEGKNMIVKYEKFVGRR